MDPRVYPHNLFVARALGEALAARKAGVVGLCGEDDEAMLHLFTMASCIEKMWRTLCESIRANQEIRRMVETSRESHVDTYVEILRLIDSQNDMMRKCLPMPPKELAEAMSELDTDHGYTAKTRIAETELELNRLKRERDEALAGVREWGPTLLAMEKALALFGDEIMFRTYDGKRIGSKEMIEHLRNKTEIGVAYLSDIVAASQATLRVRAADDWE